MPISIPVMPSKSSTMIYINRVARGRNSAVFTFENCLSIRNIIPSLTPSPPGVKIAMYPIIHETDIEDIRANISEDATAKPIPFARK